MNNNFKKNIIFSVAYQMLVMILPFILTPYLSRVLDPDGLGAYNHANSFAYYFFLFAMLGVNSYGTREIAKVHDDRKKLTETFWQIYYIQAFLAFVAIALYVLMIELLELDNFLYHIQIVYLSSVFFDINWFAFGIEKFQSTTTRFALMKIVTIALIFLLVKKAEDVWIYATIMTASVVVSLFFVWPLVFKNVDFQAPKPKVILKHLKPNAVLMLPILATSVFSYLDNFMIGFMCDIENVTYYSYANSLPNMLLSIMTGVTSVLLSRISSVVTESKDRAKSLFEASVKYSTILNFALTFGAVGVAKNFINIYLGERYSSTLILFYLMICTVPLNGLSALTKTAYMIPSGMDKEAVKSSVIGALTKVVMNLILISLFGVAGACISSIISYLVIVAVQCYYTRREVSYSSALKCAPVFLSISGMMLAYLFAIDMLNMNIWLKICIQVGGGAAIYCLFALLYFLKTKDTLLSSVLSRFKHK